jgi:hypothetical protein
MKFLSVLGLGVISAFSFNATAAGTFTFVASSAVMPCTGSANQLTCQMSAQPPAQSVTLNLSTCSNDGQGGTNCSATWTLPVSASGMNFTAVVMVNEMTTSSGTVAYQITYGMVQASNIQTIGVLVPASAALTDSAILLGQGVKSTTDATITNMPILAIGPTNAALEVKMQNLKSTSLSLQN